MMWAEVIGDPIAHSKSPLIHRFWLDALGIAGRYERTRVGADDLAAFLAERRRDSDWRGCNVTVPHKERIVPLLDTLTREARAIGAVNTIRRSEDGRLHGRNSDVHGIWRALDQVSKRRVVLIGAGGAARAAVFALSKFPVEHVTIMNRSIDRADALLAEFRLPGEAAPIGSVPAADLVINASSLGMVGQPDLAVELSRLPADATVFDMVYAPLETRLLAAARARGLRTVGGLTMLIEQAAEAFSVFYRQAPPRDDDAELRALLSA